MTSIRWTRRAGVEAARAAAWWASHRPEAPDLLRREIEGALELLAAAPSMGAPYEVPGVRRLVLPRTRYQVFYAYDPGLAQVDILSVWSSLRGRGPRLRPL